MNTKAILFTIALATPSVALADNSITNNNIVDNSSAVDNSRYTNNYNSNTNNSSDNRVSNSTNNSTDNSVRIDDRSTSTTVSNDNRVDNSVTTHGPTHNGDSYVDHSSSATGGNVGDTTSESNNVNNNDSVATVGNTTSSSDNSNSNSNDSEGGDVEFNYTSTQADNAAMSAASVLTGYCQNGGSAQGFNGGFSLTGNDAFCDAIRLSDHYWVQVERQQKIAYMLGCATPKPALAARCAETGARMLEAMDRAWEASDVANDLLMASKFSGQVEAVTGPFARIGGILALLLLL